MTAPALPASTVIVLRRPPDAQDALETYLLRRAPTHAFLPGAYVFPGGRLDREDGDPAWRPLCEGLERLEARLAPNPPAASPLEHGVAAVREVFEETGILLVRHHDALDRGAIDQCRRELLAGARSFLQCCRDLGARPDFDALHPWARWITPEFEPRRFDTLYLVHVLGEGQTATVVPGEAVDGRWMRAADALAAFDQEAMLFAPPTVRTLEEIDALDGPARLAAIAASRSLLPILPRLLAGREVPVMVLPGDAEYGPTSLEARPGPTRFVRRGKRWVPLGEDRAPAPGGPHA